MAEVAEIVKDVEHVEKETEKKVVDLEDGKTESKKDSKPKENGKKSESNEKSEPETNGKTDTDTSEVTTATTATKRKSGAADTTDGSGQVDGTTPEKKAKISTEENDSKNGETAAAPEVISVEGSGEAKNTSYQKH